MFYNTEITDNDNEIKEDTVTSLEEKRKRLSEYNRELLEKQLKNFSSNILKFKR